MYERTSIVNKLLGAGADPYALDDQSNTPVHLAIMSSPASFEILISAILPSSVFNKGELELIVGKCHSYQKWDFVKGFLIWITARRLPDLQLNNK